MSAAKSPMPQKYATLLLFAAMLSIACKERAKTKYDEFPGKPSAPSAGAETGGAAADKFSVAVKDGLNLRDKPATTGKLLITIPYRTEVTVIKHEGDEITIQGRKGRWAQIQYQNKTGYAFSGFLSPVASSKDSVTGEYTGGGCEHMGSGFMQSLKLNGDGSFSYDTASDFMGHAECDNGGSETSVKGTYTQSEGSVTLKAATEESTKTYAEAPGCPKQAPKTTKEKVTYSFTMKLSKCPDGRYALRFPEDRGAGELAK